MSVMRYRLIITPRTETVTATPVPPPPIGGDELPFYPAVDVDTKIGNHGAIILPDGVETTITVEFMVPPNILSITKAVIVVVSAASGDLRWGVETDFAQLDSNEDYNVNTDTIAAGQTAVTINKMTSLDITASLSGATEYDVVGLDFTRYADNVLDTINDVVYFIGAYIE